MKCVETTELEQFLRGDLAAARLVEIDAHVAECAACRSALAETSAHVGSRATLSDTVFALHDCPEYEDLSDYVDATLDASAMNALNSHLGICDLCAADVTRLQELRSQAALRGAILVTPGASQAQRAVSAVWKKALASVVALGAVAAVAVVFVTSTKAPVGTNTVAVKPPTTITRDHKPVTTAQAPTVSTGTQKPTPPQSNRVAQVPPAQPKPVVVLRDGRYVVAKSTSSGKLFVAKADGTPVQADRSLVQMIAGKLATGRVHGSGAALAALATIRTRDGGPDYVAPPTAPRPVSPSGIIVLSATPRFTWSKVDLAREYRLVVRDTNGNIVYQAALTGTSHTANTSLVRGSVYTWQVGARFGDDEWSNSAAVKFKVLSQTDLNSIQRVRHTLPGSHLALAVAYESCGLYTDAAQEYAAVRRANSGSGLAHHLR